jgi:hypothetical protein
MDISLTN